MTLKLLELSQALTELKTALNESLSRKLDKRAEEILDESRRYFTENFSKLVSACESREKRVEYTAADLQVLTEEANKKSLAWNDLCNQPRCLEPRVGRNRVADLRVFLTENNRQGA